jgi:hypothetical protein
MNASEALEISKKTNLEKVCEPWLQSFYRRINQAAETAGTSCQIDIPSRGLMEKYITEKLTENGYKLEPVFAINNGFATTYIITWE